MIFGKSRGQLEDILSLIRYYISLCRNICLCTFWSKFDILVNDVETTERECNFQKCRLHVTTAAAGMETQTTWLYSQLSHRKPDSSFNKRMSCILKFDGKLRVGRPGFFFQDICCCCESSVMVLKPFIANQSTGAHVSSGVGSCLCE